MAREEEEHTQLITLHEVQAAEIQLQISTAQRQHLIQTAANEELLVGIKTKVDALTVAHPLPRSPRRRTSKPKQRSSRSYGGD